MTEERITIELKLDAHEDSHILFGTHDKHLKIIEEATQCVIHSRGESIQVEGSPHNAEKVILVLNALRELIQRGIEISSPDVVTALKMVDKEHVNDFINLYEEEIMKDRYGKAIRAKNSGQKRYIQAIQQKDVVFGIGPAGTGKTFLAVVLAIRALKKGEVQKIILTRPAVEAGENLGFLPGDLKEKVDPYLRPVYDALYQIFGVDHTNRLMERGVIEIAPLAYMRGRTLEDAFVILDEAQNTTVAQMKMFLTRLGFNSKMVINGDVSQIDLPKNKGIVSGLVHAKATLANIPQIEFISFDAGDVVRHPVVAQIIRAYDQSEQL